LGGSMLWSHFLRFSTICGVIIGAFFKNLCYDHFLHNLALFSTFFCENIF
jgi:hypothetical protein